MNLHCITIKTLGVLACLLPIWASAQIVAPVGQPDERRTTGNVPVAFYGKVVDQDGQPLAGAKINLDLYFGYMTSDTGGEMKHEKTTLETDQDGNFGLSGAKGITLTVESINKKGYELSQKAERSFGYNESADIFHPDANNPVVFKMWKKKGAQPLVRSAWRGLVTCDGTGNSFDLQEGNEAKDKLQIACTRTPLTSPPPGNGPFDYKFEIAVVGGGIQATADEFTYQAPEAGYLPNLTIAKKAGEPGWQGRVKQEFYLKTADGHYGRLTVDWYDQQDSPTHLEWESFINPIGSRNLEYDKLAEIRKHASHPDKIRSADEQ